MRNLTLAQANAALCINAARVELLVRRRGSNTDPASCPKIPHDDGEEEEEEEEEEVEEEDDTKVKATVIVVNAGTPPAPQHLDDSGVEISENGSCSSAEVEVISGGKLAIIQ